MKGVAQAGPVKIGVSSCLLGQKVRYDAGHKHDRFVTEALGPFVEWVPVCPEVEAGFGVPRPAMHLSRQGQEVRLVETGSGKDHTRVMERYSRRRVEQLRKLGLSGYILKKDSPSCGMSRVKVRNPSGMPERVGTGLFAEALQRRLLGLPVEEEGRLNDPRLRENFIERVFAFERVTRLFRGRWRSGDVVAFHTAHKLQLMAHSNEAYRELGRWVAKVAAIERSEFKAHYLRSFMAALSRIATPARNTNVLQHAAGYFKRDLPSPQRSELAELIHDYRKGLVPLVVPLTLLQHYVRLYQVDYLKGQVFLDPHPKELMLRNHV